MVALAAVVVAAPAPPAQATPAAPVPADAPVTGPPVAMPPAASPPAATAPAASPLASLKAAANQRSPLAGHLDADGRLLPSASGADLDPTGYRVTTGDDGTPRFVPAVGAADPAAVAQGTFDDRFGRPGVDLGTIRAVAVSGTDVYIGGDFGTAAGQDPMDSYRGVAHWDGHRWRPMGSGANNSVQAAVVHGDDVYIAGLFTSVGGVAANGIARWDGSAWSALGTGLTGDTTGILHNSGPGYALTVFDDKVIVGGQFWWAGGVVAHSVAAWDGSAWSALGAGACTNECDRASIVKALATDGTSLYMGGSFERAGAATNVRSVARWNGSAWSGMGGGVKLIIDPGRVDSIAVDGTSVYIGGQFDTAGSTLASSVARWNGSVWTALGAGLTKTGSFSSVPAPVVPTIAVHGGSVYVGGDFDAAGGVAAAYFARWNGTTWSVPPTGTLHDIPLSLTSTPAGLIVTGPLDAGSLYLNRIGRWTGTEWEVFGQGIGRNGTFGVLNALAVTSTGQVYAAGVFDQAGQAATKSIARWDGTRWHTLQGGVTDPLAFGDLHLGTVHAMVVDGNGDLYVGGVFAQAGAVDAANVARWDGDSWSPLGSGTDGPVYGLTVDGDTLFVGGAFSTAGGLNAAAMARYDLGSGTWSRLHPVHQLFPGDSVRQFLVAGDWVVIGGNFGTFGGQHMFSLLVWNKITNQFTDLGLGVSFLGQPGFVHGMALSGDHLYVGGRFARAGFETGPNSILAPGLARLSLDTELWSLVGNPSVNTPTSGVFGLQLVGTDLYVGGDFTTAGGSPAPAVARFSTTTETWSPLGSGMVGFQLGAKSVRSFAVWGRDLIVGGEFITAGGVPASSFSMYGMPPTVPGPPQDVQATVTDPALSIPDGPVSSTVLDGLDRPAAVDVTVTVSWSPPDSDGGSAITSYTATASPGGETCTWSTGPLTCNLTGLEPNTDYVVTVRATNVVGQGPASAPSTPARYSVGPRFHALTPARILDTRPGPEQSGLAGPFGPTMARVLQVTGHGGVPSGATAVILNVTSVNPSEASFLSLTPDTLAPGQVPSTSNLNLAPGTVRPNLVMARLNGSGQSTIYNNSGTVHVLADVVGWFGRRHRGR